MSQLNQIELQNLRHLIGAHDTSHQKMQSYAEQATNPQVKAYFQKSAQDAQSTKQQLLSFLQ
jgi:type III secretory pathway component EscR